MKQYLGGKKMKKIPPIKSPLRYPGGKSKALKQILPLIPNFKEFREPLVGGGAVFFAVKQLYPNKKYWINDLNRELYLLWKYCKININNLVSEIEKHKSKYEDGKKLYLKIVNKDDKKLTDFERAVRFFILNRITFSGLAESGGYSNQAFKTRFTDSSIDRLKKVNKVLQETKITSEDYEKLITDDGKGVFIFLDPPYLSKTKSKLYGKKGDLHLVFDHKRFADIMKKCKHKWLITYDDSPEVRKLYPFANIYEWELQYGMNNYKQKTAKKGKELFISNFDISSLKKNEKQTTISSSFQGFDIRTDSRTSNQGYGTTGSIVVDSEDGRSVYEEQIDMNPHPPANQPHFQRSLRSAKKGKRPKKVKSKKIEEINHEPLN